MDGSGDESGGKVTDIDDQGRKRIDDIEFEFVGFFVPSDVSQSSFFLGDALGHQGILKGIDVIDHRILDEFMFLTKFFDRGLGVRKHLRVLIKAHEGGS